MSERHIACGGGYGPPHSWHTCDEVDALTERAERAEAQVHRVREEIDGDRPIPNASGDLGNIASYCAGYVDAFRRIQSALDGDGDE